MKSPIMLPENENKAVLYSISNTLHSVVSTRQTSKVQVLTAFPRPLELSC